MTLDHIGLTVGDIERCKAFYTQALAPLGITLLMHEHGWLGFGRDRQPQFWIVAGAEPNRPLHVAFAAENRAQVRAFHAAALAAGATDNGAPGLRPQYHPNYYGAFVIAPDGHNVEAVCHRAEP